MAYKQITFPDMSHWKPVQDFKKAKATYPLLISKATQGTGYTDPTLKSFIKGCEDNQIPYWLYCFATKGKEKAGAMYMVQVCKSLVGPHFVGYILDAEKNPSDGTYPTASGVHEALQYLSLSSEKTMLYTGYADYSRYRYAIDNRPENCAWWEARYGANDGKDHCDKYEIHNGVDVHQFTSMDKNPNDGITDKLDVSHSTGTLPPTFFTSPHVWLNGVEYKADQRYRVVREVYIHEFPNISAPIVKPSKKKDDDRDSKLDVDSTVRAIDVKVNDNGAVWVRIPKGWVRAYAPKKNITYLK